MEGLHARNLLSKEPDLTVTQLTCHHDLDPHAFECQRTWPYNYHQPTLLRWICHPFKDHCWKRLKASSKPTKIFHTPPTTTHLVTNGYHRNLTQGHLTNSLEVHSCAHPGYQLATISSLSLSLSFFFPLLNLSLTLSQISLPFYKISIFYALNFILIITFNFNLWTLIVTSYGHLKNQFKVNLVMSMNQK